MNTPLLQAVKLRIAVPGRILIKDLELSIVGGEFLALLGGNGTGKSLLLRTLAGLRPATQGEVRLDGLGIGQLHAGPSP